MTSLSWDKRRELYDPEYRRIFNDLWTVEDAEQRQSRPDEFHEVGTGVLQIEETNETIQASEAILEIYIQSIAEEFCDEELVLGADTGKEDTPDRIKWKHLWGYRPSEENWSIELVNIKGFCETEMHKTLSFIRTEPGIKSEYAEYQANLQRIYSDLEKEKMGFLPLSRIKKRNLAVIKLDEVGFVRVLIRDTYPDVHDLSLGQVCVQLLDYNSSRLVSPKKLMYATSLSTRLVCQANDLFPYGLASYRHLPEFKIALSSFVRENGCFFSAKVLHISKNNVALVKLFLDGLSEPVNQMLKINVIKLFKPEELITENEVRSHAYVTHVETTGEMAIQFKSNVYNLYCHELQSITEEAIESQRAKGPYLLNKSGIYLALYPDGYYYRAKIASHAKLPADEKVLTYFIDYGDHQYVDPLFIVPAAAVNVFLPHFPPQAVKVRLNNGSNFPVHLLPAVMPPTMETIVETLKPATDDNCAVVEVMTFDEDGELRYLSKRLGKGTQDALGESSLCSKFRREISFTSLEYIAMKNTPWRDAQGNTLSVIAEGDILDVFVPLSDSPEYFSIQPFGLQNVLENVESNLTKWLDLFQPREYCPPDPIIFGSIYIMDLKAYVRVKLLEYIYNQESICVKVLFIDYGCYVEVLKNKVCMISTDACSLPCMGARGELLLSQNTSRQWSQIELRHFVNKTDQKRFLFRVSSSHYDENECLCVVGELFEHPSTNEEIPSPDEIRKALETPLELHKLLVVDD